MSSVEHFFYEGSVLEVSGPDAASFLQGQFANDVAGLGVGRVVYGLWLSLKGKILADSFILRRSEDSFLIVCYEKRCPEIAEWLDSRLFMDEVELGEPRTARGASVWRAETLGDAVLSELPPNGGFLESAGVVSFWGRRDSAKVLEAVDLGGAESLFTELSRSSAEIGERELAVAALRSGVYSVGKDILEDLPQEVGLDEVGISYAKGCYVGQEVMARLKSMGRSRRSLVTRNEPSPREKYCLSRSAETSAAMPCG